VNRSQFLRLLLLVKLVVGFVAIKVLGPRMRLGDTPDYLAGAHIFRNDPTSTSYWMSVTGSLFSRVLGGAFLSNVPLLLLAWYGIARACREIELDRRRWVWLFVALMSPSYQLWSSIHSKEAVVGFGLCLLVAFALQRFKGTRQSRADRLLALMAGLLVVFFKPLYAAAVCWLAAFAFIVPQSRSRAMISSLIAAMMVTTIVVVVAIAAPEASSTISQFHLHFSGAANFTRLDRSWAGVLDVIRDAPLGMFAAFVGPTYREAQQFIAMTPFFVEGVITLAGLILLALRACLRVGSLRISRFWFLFGFLLLLLAANYPFGHFNPGSALRYKQSFYGALVLLFFAFAFDPHLRLRNVREVA
jgi:hypothetical protein